MSSPRESEQRDRRDGRETERGGRGRKMNDSPETLEILVCPLLSPVGSTTDPFHLQQVGEGSV